MNLNINNQFTHSNTVLKSHLDKRYCYPMDIEQPELTIYGIDRKLFNATLLYWTYLAKLTG